MNVLTLVKQEDGLSLVKKPHNYYLQMIKRDKVKRSKNYGTGEAIGGTKEKENKVYTYTHKYPTSILEFSNATQKGKLHTTQKPVPLFEYLIKTYANKGETVLDNCMGSGTTCVASKKLKRRYIGIELDSKYFDIACERLSKTP